MRVIFDTNILVPLLSEIKPDFKPTDPNTGAVITDIARRVEALIDQIDNVNGTVVIPTPVLAEFLVGIDKKEHQAHLNLIKGVSCFEIAPFDELAAIECSQMPTIQELRQMMKSDSANKIKFDRQIIAIAKSLSVDEVWTHDKGVYNRCKQLGISVKTLSLIEPNPIQTKMEFEQVDAALQSVH